MNYEIFTSRWHCPECGFGVKLFFSPREGEEESSDEFVCINVACQSGHELPQEIHSDAIENADEEFYAAMQRGTKVGEAWRAPDQASDQFEQTI